MRFTKINSPNFDPILINPEFIIIHYTGGNFERVCELMSNPTKKVSSHFVIDTSGRTYEVVEHKKDTCFRAWHSGKSQFITQEGKVYTDLNTYAIGIELVNNNGNLIPYPKKQISSLVKLIIYLIRLYPKLNNPSLILGHEEVSGYRGKVDPGKLFPWKGIYNTIFPNINIPAKTYNCPNDLIEQYKKFLKSIPPDDSKIHQFWHALNATMEKIG